MVVGMSFTADSLIAAMEDREKLSRGAVCDFGLDGGIPFGRVNWDLYVVYRTGWKMGKFTREELVDAACDGPKLTILVRRLVCASCVTVKTVYDNNGIGKETD